ncbi:MAG TPA: SIMPL domain-containing protein [Nevskiaceae bacterium]
MTHATLPPHRIVHHALRPLVALLAATALSLAALPASAESAETPNARHVITVEGHGEVRVAPDEARLSMTAQYTDKDLDAAQGRVNAMVNAFSAKAKALGIPANDLSTAAYSVTSEYSYPKEGRKFEGYQVSRGIQLTIRDLANLGPLMQAASAAGIPSVSPPELLNSEAPRYRLEALRGAARDARAQATALAAAMDIPLGAVRSLTTVENPGAQPILMRAMAAPSAAPDASMHVGVGLIEYNARVRAVFSIGSGAGARVQ